MASAAADFVFQSVETFDDGLYTVGTCFFICRPLHSPGCVKLNDAVEESGIAANLPGEWFVLMNKFVNQWGLTLSHDDTNQFLDE